MRVSAAKTAAEWVTVERDGLDFIVKVRHVKILTYFSLDTAEHRAKAFRRALAAALRADRRAR